MVTKASVMYDQTYQDTFTPYTQTENTYNQEKNNRLPYHPKPLTEKNVSNNSGQHIAGNFAQNLQRQTVDDLHSSNATSMLSQQSNINENNFHRVLIHEPNMNLMDNYMKHKTASENMQPIIQEMQLHNSQTDQQTFTNVELANPSVGSNYIQEFGNSIQELGNSVPIAPFQNDYTITPLTRARNEIIEALHDLQRKMQTTNERLERLDSMEQKIDSIQRKIDSNIINEIPMKPRIFPLSTLEEIQRFTKDNAVYDETICYFKFLNSMTLKDSVHQCMKEAITMQLAKQLTWWGNHNKFPFYDTVLCQAIFQAVASNRYYPKPTREEFQREIVASLKVAKQRFRNARGRHPGIQGNRRNLQVAADALYNKDGNHEDERNRLQNEHNNNTEDLETNSDDSGEHSSNIDNQ